MLNAKSATGNAVIIGAGTMGGVIAAQLANAGWQVRLLDVAGPDPNDKTSRSQAAANGLARVVSNKPPLLFLPEFANRIHVGNTQDDLACLQAADWIIEAVVEKMDVKQAMMALIETHAGPQTLVSSNTSGLSLNEMTAGRSPAFRSRFLGTHFLNPPRYLKLLEVIPLPETSPEVAANFQAFAEEILGQRVIFARDTPGFISTRIWITHLLDTIYTAVNSGLTVEEADYLTGPLIGRPRSATFRMADLVGLDIIASVAQNQYARLPNDPLRERLILPDVIQKLIAAGNLGDKSGAGFYKREGKAILALDLQTMTYRLRQETQIATLESLAKLQLCERLARLKENDAEAGQKFLNGILDNLIGYAQAIGPEIADDVLAMDRVMQWGFHWEMGPFAIQDCRRSPDATPAFTGAGRERAYRVFGREALQSMPEEKEYLVLADLKAAGRTIRETEEAALIDLGDGVACLEFHTKMNTFNPALVRFVDEARERAEQDFAALVIGNQAANFSAGYNLNLFLEAMAAEDWNRLDALLRDIQFAFLRLKYARIPIVGAPHGYTLGAGCEGSLHCHALQAAPELVMGLPERNVGVVPAGGGVKETLARAMQDWQPGTDAFPRIERVFDLLAAFPKNSGNALEARQMGFLRPTDGHSRNADRQIYDAKARALEMANAGYTPREKQKVWVFGADTLARLRVKIHNLWRAGAFSDHDRLIADRIAFVLSGGSLPTPQAVSEDYLLKLEREVFITLAREPKTAERMRHILVTGKPLKN